MKDSFRQSMSWLHTWSGLVFGWLLCAIFLTGTLSVFREPITRWMEARPLLLVDADAGTRVSADALATATAVSQAVRHLSEQAADARFWRIELPRREGDAMQMFWRKSGTAQGNEQAAMHPVTGSLLPQPWGRATEGGRHFMSFHYMLHLPEFGYWVVGAVSMCMLVALVSGVVVHRRIFQDFFTFRPGKGQRSWLDAHNATAVLTLPFLFMIVYTGLAIFYTTYMPWPLQAAYGSGDKASSRYQAELAHDGTAPLRRPRLGTPGVLHDLPPLLQQAQALLGVPVHTVIVEQPGDRNMTLRMIVRVTGLEASRHIINPGGSVAFDGVSGKVLQVQLPTPASTFASEQVHEAMEALHLVRFGGWSMKWLYFLSGLLGTVMMATGIIMFSVKRRRKSMNEFGAATAGMYRVVEWLNVTAVAGICVACIGYFYLNRLLPADMPGRITWEIRGFLLVWLITLLHAMARPPARAWVEQLWTAAALCLCLPLLNGLTTGQHVGRYLMASDWPRAGLEITVMLIGLALAWAAHRTRRGWRTSAMAKMPQRHARAEVQA
ncbi:PepSY domain-containing protein [Pigmentiphaga aceris]|uniref:PepSY domain-containing protein n=1 Tax=Pigmentiphaga aceris TaxID=1940612 RepID=A0A5C0AT85_9BURK|nr:PepSY-associated TM helix domain-containing protein [Pigmentiphaga aceris]QEI05305.1 PepSY domain-containing protein [Pigmentiphaga aceris]